MGRRRRFNPRQPRDWMGRWTRGGGSSRRRSSGSKFRSGRKILTASQQRQKAQTLSNFRRVQQGALAGAAVGAAMAGPYGALAGATVGGVAGGRRRKRRR